MFVRILIIDNHLDNRHWKNKYLRKTSNLMENSTQKSLFNLSPTEKVDSLDEIDNTD